MKTDKMRRLEYKYNKDIKEIMIDAVKETKSFNQAAKKVKLTPPTFSSYLAKLEIREEAKKHIKNCHATELTEQEKEDIKEKYRNGTTQKMLLKQYKIGMTKLQNVLKGENERFGIKLSMANMEKKTMQKELINRRVFENVNIGDILQISHKPKKIDSSNPNLINCKNCKVIGKTKYLIILQEIDKPWKRESISWQQLVCRDVEITQRKVS